MKLLNQKRKKHLTSISNAELRNAERTEKMKPLLIMLKSLKDEIGEVEGINFYLSGNSATVSISDYPERIEYYISHGHPGFSKFILKTIRTFSAVGEMDEGSRNEEKNLFDSAEEALAVVVKQLGKFIGVVRARSEFDKR